MHFSAKERSCVSYNRGRTLTWMTSKTYQMRSRCPLS
ncbi:hypothetical protein NP493_24g01003 [Ridgeia piscesae]|uniref:Uncharacterized protein n=1 Tax=Ridgeia piscesae TaxID=27915 RepID=A0AAD9PD90_RIDPI|nr:hypothetical protein NP493_24g01003 [Ridgeia piscesae]